LSKAKVSKAITMGVKQLSMLLLLLCAGFSAKLVDASLMPALFVLGDSTVDTGNQNYITSVIKSNYPPYGRDFVPPGPTGRFSNGKLANDFVAEYLGLPSPVNFLDPTASGPKLLTGVNLASSGSGFLDITGQLFGVMNLTRQLENLGTVQAEIIQQIGLPATTQLFGSSLFLISTGSNDFVNNYNINPVVFEQYSPSQYQTLLLESINRNLMALYNYGARKVIINSLGPVGCCPEQLNLYNSQDGVCIEKVNLPLRNFNVGLKDLVIQMRGQYPDFNLVYANAYDLIQGLVSDPQSNGYSYSDTACCGEGSWRGLPCANPISTVCVNADEYVFWDLFHPSQKTHNALANAAIYGDVDQMYPTNIQGLI
jgi:phospholipase/lecithinase/hemolysin